MPTLLHTPLFTLLHVEVVTHLHTIKHSFWELAQYLKPHINGLSKLIQVHLLLKQVPLAIPIRPLPPIRIVLPAIHTAPQAPEFHTAITKLLLMKLQAPLPIKFQLLLLL